LIDSGDDCDDGDSSGDDDDDDDDDKAVATADRRAVIGVTAIAVTGAALPNNDKQRILHVPILIIRFTTIFVVVSDSIVRKDDCIIACLFFLFLFVSFSFSTPYACRKICFFLNK
jgi:hypothetical protein